MVRVDRENFWKSGFSRMHLFEVHETRWCPGMVSHFVTDAVQFLWVGMLLYTLCADLLANAVKQSGATRIVDLCSGSGGPLPCVLNKMRAEYGLPLLRGVLTDIFPHPDAWDRLKKRAYLFTPGEGEGYAAGLSYETEPVDATRTPKHLHGFRTLFASFHHFDAHTGRMIIQDAVDNNEGIAIFELTQRSVFSIGFFLILGWIGSFIIPFLIFPFSLMRVFLSSVLPVVPAFVAFDGAVSCARTYTPLELEALVASIDGHERYQWQIGARYLVFWPIPVTFCIGYPIDPKTE